ncbi:MAG: hypothetical protein ACFFCS_21735 [Candidatus Hodarchaeota archaeon]
MVSKGKERVQIIQDNSDTFVMWYPGSKTVLKAAILILSFATAISIIAVLTHMFITGEFLYYIILIVVGFDLLIMVVQSKRMEYIIEHSKDMLRLRKISIFGFALVNKKIPVKQIQEINMHSFLIGGHNSGWDSYIVLKSGTKVSLDIEPIDEVDHNEAVRNLKKQLNF